jgi:hypothetical protein
LTLVETLHFTLYRDDGLDVLLNGEQDLAAFDEHINGLHQNLQWTVNCGCEGGYLDLWLMIENGRIEWRNFKKIPPVYVGPDSFHDPAFRGAFVKGVGHRLRIYSSKTEYFAESVEETARISRYQDITKNELMKFGKEDPIELIRKEWLVSRPMRRNLTHGLAELLRLLLLDGGDDGC